MIVLDPDNSQAFEHLSLVYLRLGRWADARRSAERSLEISDSRFLAWNNLGVALYQSGETARALDAWHRAVELQPALYDALYNLGTRAAEHGRSEQARWALEMFIATAPQERYTADLRRARVLLTSLGRDRPDQ